MIPTPYDVSLAIWQLGKAIITTIGVHQQRPMYKIHIHIINAKTLETLFKTLSDTGVVGRPDFGHDEDIFALNAAVKGSLEAGAYFVFVAVAVGGVNEGVAGFEGVRYGELYLAGSGLPGSCILYKFLLMVGLDD